MCKEMPIIRVSRVVDPKRIMEKMERRGGGEAHGVADPKNIIGDNSNNIMIIIIIN
jgi:hypothetical protein